MLYSIDNGILSVKIESLGAQLMSLRSASGTEYLWQRDEKYWRDCSPVLFPYIARLYGGGYTLSGRRYEMGIHGFAAKCEFELGAQSEESVTMVLRESGATLSQYPFRFTFSVSYTLEGSELIIRCTVENRDSTPMPFAVGGHPGFNVPFEEGTEFSDYRLTFGEVCIPDRIGFTDEVFVSGVNKPYPLKEGRIIPLDHSLFDEDAIILQNMARSVTLESDRTGKKLTVSYPDMPYLGFWHMPKTDAPYVCIEPWSALPSRQGIVEELTCKSDMITLAPGGSYNNQWTITVTEA